MTSSPSLDDLHRKAPEAAEFMKLFGTANRLMLLCHIARKECSVSDLQDDLGLKQPGLSQQLAELRQAGAVRTRRESRQIYYSIADERVRAVIELLLKLFCDSGDMVASDPLATAQRPQDVKTMPPPFEEAAQFARLD
ncbi:hypothetical protein LMIY3S_05063 [Labrys miyagiensis]